jgi:hypothetical protein
VAQRTKQWWLAENRIRNMRPERAKGAQWRLKARPQLDKLHEGGGVDDWHTCLFGDC